MGKIPDRIGGYTIRNVLGKGGMGVVYEAVDPQTGETVALKTVYVADKRQRINLEREVRGLARLQHPGVVRIRARGTDDGTPWFAMDLLTGKTLSLYCQEVLWDSGILPGISTSDPTLGDVPGTTETVGNLDGRLTQSTMDSGEWVKETGRETGERPAGNPGKHPMEPRRPAAGNRLQEVLDISLVLSNTLTYLHGEGIVHRDLKPSNIILDANGLPILMDFGLMLEFWGIISRDELKSSHSSGGTLMYIAPEQLTGDVVDARADLYSLGCILYILITGRLPFRAGSTRETVRSHLRVIPVAPTAYVTGVPTELNSLIMTLLAKSPRNRIGHARDVALILEKLGARDPRAHLYPKPKTCLYRPGFAGRHELLKEMAEKLGTTVAEKGGLVMLGGESGIGKTRFMMEMQRTAVQLEMQVYTCECDPPGTPEDADKTVTRPPLHPLIPLFENLAERCRKEGHEFTDMFLGARGKILAPYFTALKDLPGQKKYPEPGNIPLNAARMRLFNAVSQTLFTVAGKAPVLLLVDDFHWADELTAELMEFSCRSGLFDQTPVLCVISFRSGEMTAAIQRMINSSRVQHIEMESLNSEDVKTMVRDMLAHDDPTPEFIRFLTENSRGNPFFVAEYLRGCVREEVLFRDRKGIWKITPGENHTATETDFNTMPMPRSLVNLVDRRLQHLSSAARDLAAAASVIGRDVDTLILWNITSYSEAVIDALDELLESRVLEEPEPGCLRFVHDLLQRITYGKLDPDQRRKIHYKTAESYETLRPDWIPDHHGIIAHHWEKGGNTEKARKHYRLAGEKAVSRTALVEAEKMFRSYLELTDSITEESVETRITYARAVLYFLGRAPESFEQIQTAVAEAKNIGNRQLEMNGRRDASFCLLTSGRFQEAKTECEKMLRIARETGNRLEEANAMSLMGSIATRLENTHRTVELYRRVLDIYRELDYPAGEAKMFAKLGVVYSTEGRLDDALECMTAAFALYKKQGKTIMSALNLKNISGVYWKKGEYERARKAGEQGLQMIRKTGDHFHEGRVLANLGRIYAALGDMNRAASIFNEALERVLEMGVPLDEYFLRMKMGYFENDRAEFEAAALHFNRALEIAESLNQTRMIPDPLTGLAEIDRITGSNLESAEARLDRAESIARTIVEVIPLVNVLCARGHLELARNRSGRPAYTEAQDLADQHNLVVDVRIRKDLESLKKAVNVFESGGERVRGNVPRADFE